MMSLINMVILLLSTLLGIAFFTLMERKIISYSQTRKGPNKVAMMGLIQPIADAIKLMSKEVNLKMSANFLLFLISPMMNIVCSMVMWLALPYMFNFNFMKMSIIFLMSCTTFNTMSIMMMGWASNSNYAMIGTMRTIAQMISYEVNFMMILMIMMNVTEQMNLTLSMKMQKYLPLVVIMPAVFVMWMLTILAETNRTPFDFSEGESELVSGFNIEFSSKSFMLLFLAEYSSILMMSMLTTVMFLSSMQQTMKFMLLYSMVCMMFIWTRTTLPRFRYDKLMKLNWKQMLPTTTFILMLSFIMKEYSTKSV